MLEASDASVQGERGEQGGMGKDEAGGEVEDNQVHARQTNFLLLFRLHSSLVYEKNKKKTTKLCASEFSTPFFLLMFCAAGAGS